MVGREREMRKEEKRREETGIIIQGRDIEAGREEGREDRYNNTGGEIERRDERKEERQV